MMQSDQINELMSALAKAQGHMSHASKDNQNPHFRSKYADLASVWQACRKPLSDNGLAVTQTLDIAGEKQVLVTTLAHASGQWIKSIMILPTQKPGPQEIGSCLSYCRRYALASMVGVYQDDDDAEVAQKPYRETETKYIPTRTTLNEEQREQLKKYLAEFPEADKGLCEKYGLKDIFDIPQEQWGTIVAMFKTKQKTKLQSYEEASGK